MRITTTRPDGGQEPGATTDLPDCQAEHLIAQGYATEETEAEPEPKSAPKRRKAATIEADD